MGKKLTVYDAALTQSVLDLFSDIPEREEDISISFSEKFERDSHRLIGKTRRKRRRYVNSTTKKLLIAAIIISLLSASFFSTGTIVEPEQDGSYIFNMTSVAYGDYYHYEFYFDQEIVDAAPDVIQDVYFPTYIPEGFIPQHRRAVDDRVSAAWETVTGTRISYRQCVFFDNEWRESISYDPENDVAGVFDLGDFEVFRFKNSRGISYFWSDHLYYYELQVDTGVDEETMQKIFESIEWMPEQEIYDPDRPHDLYMEKQIATVCIYVIFCAAGVALFVIRYRKRFNIECKGGKTMKSKLTKRDKVTIWVSIPFVLYALYILLAYWFGWIGMEAELTLNVFFPVLAFGYMWFLAGRTGPWWALPVLLFCLLIEASCEMIEIFERHGCIDLHLLWVWMQGPKLWGPIVGYGIGSLLNGVPRDKVTQWISLSFALYALFLLMMYWFGDSVLAATHGWFFFPAAALLYMWFIAQRHGPLWGLIALLFCMLVEIILTAGSGGLKLSSLWFWMDGPTLWGPIIGYGVGSLIFVSKHLFYARKKREEADT